jgi:phage baseplate assembly protein W
VNLALPLSFDHRGRTAESADERYVRDLIEAVLFTSPGERVMRPEFGSGVSQLLFQPNSPELASTTEMLVQGALTQWLNELIIVTAVRVEAEDAALRVTVGYTRRGDDRQHVQIFITGGGPS